MFDKKNKERIQLVYQIAINDLRFEERERETNGDYSRFNSGYCEDVRRDAYMKTHISCF